MRPGRNHFLPSVGFDLSGRRTAIGVHYADADRISIQYAEEVVKVAKGQSCLWVFPEFGCEKNRAGSVGLFQSRMTS